MTFALEVLEAKHGDALILQYGTAAAPKIALVDGGPPGVYTQTLRPRLKEILATRGSAELPIDLIMISHIDADHVFGIMELADEQADLKQAQRAQWLSVRRLWHNSFDDVSGPGASGQVSAIVAGLPVGGPGAGAAGQLVAGVVASVDQGQRLRDQAQFLGWRVNRPFNPLVMLEAGGARKVRLSDSLALTVIGPTATRLAALKKKWDDAVAAAAAHDTSGQVAALSDKSAFNLSSIIVLAEADGKRMLLTGDARADDIRDGLQAAGLLTGGQIHVDVLKLPHHGSVRNVDLDFFQKVTADHYVISANGRDGNPDKETLELLTTARGSDQYTIHFTNQSGQNNLQQKLKQFFDADRQNGRNYAVKFRPDGQSSFTIQLA